MEFRGALLFRVPEMKFPDRKHRPSFQALCQALMWVWVVSMLAIYLSGYDDTIRLLARALIQ